MIRSRGLVDILIRDGIVVTCDDARRVVRTDLLISQGAIVGIGPAKRLGALTEARATRVIDASGCAVLPGFVQAHVHLCQTLFRGMADDLPLLTWLEKRIWPLEAAHDDASLEASAELGLYEMMRAGTTTILDMGTVHGYDAVLQACERAGVRVLGGKALMDAGRRVPKRLKESTKDALASTEALAKRWHGKVGGKVFYAHAPRFILSCTEKLFRSVVDIARAGGHRIHTHAAEHAEERAAVQSRLGASDIVMLSRWGVRGADTILAHGVQLTRAEMKRIAKERTGIVHCPSANLKLGSGVAAVAAMQELGIRVGLGADGAPCNNNMDPWVEMRRAALLAKMKSGTTSLPAVEALALATRGGAEVLGLSEQIGSIEVGKRADIVVARIDGPHQIPGGDAASRLVYASHASDVEMVLIDGEIVVSSGEHRRIDPHAVRVRAERQAKKLLSRSGIGAA